MRPVDRGPAPRVYARYEEAKPDLVDQLGCYCSYCERRMPTLLAVEHIQPKGLPAYVHLENEWTNFLLGCVNCNSAKAASVVDPANFILPDRDNSFAAFEYLENGIVDITPGLNAHSRAIAAATCELTALNRFQDHAWKEDVMFSALERVSQRVQAWVQAKEARADFNAGGSSPRAIAREAAGAGFFSIWMKAFEGAPVVREELLRIFPNTAPDCFDPNTTTVSPRPANGLAGAGKL